MSSLINIKDSKLQYNLKQITEIIPVDNTQKIKVVSVVGKARTGKSTLMNILVSKWFTENKTVFKMSDSGEHCTNGVDYVYIEELNIILLDFQGIYLGDSSQDSKLLLLAYLLSDVIIFNENQMLSNNTLSQFEPMMSFIQYIQQDDLKKTHPKLIFRIANVSMNIDPTTNMRQMLSHQNDQFQTIRNCINDLFEEPFAINTNNLDRSEIKSLKEENFNEILKIDENGFNNAISKINDYIEFTIPQRTFGNFINDIRKIVVYINNEEKIDYNELDVVKLLAEREIMKYIMKIDSSVYSEIVVDGTQHLYETNLLERISQYETILKDIAKKFNMIPVNIINAQLVDFKTKLDNLIENAKSKNKSDALIKMNKIIAENFYKFCNLDWFFTSYPYS